MARVGIALNPKAVPAAYGVCAEVWSGTSPDYVAGEVLGGNPDWTLSQAQAFVGVSILIYCPPKNAASGQKKMRV
jgi:hypothetical protein